MANLNKVFLMGNLTRDPELRYTPGGTAVADFGMAINRTWKSQEGEKREEVCFVDVTAWAKQAELIAQHFRKGRPIFVEGRLQLDSWEGQDGQKRSKLRVVLERFQFIGARPGAPAEQQRPPGPEERPEEQGPEEVGTGPGSEEIPF
jgi:single-strand DNA-binding protein